ncbi:MAG: TadE/TadG family type IV pilus assembly protein [Rhodospirillales bacterium]
MVFRRPGFLSLGRPALLENQQGSSLVEFAFAAPLIVLMIVATIEFGMIMFVSTLMESALRDAARFGITGQEPDGATRLERIIAIVEDRTIGLVDMADAKVEVRVYPTFGDVGRGEAFVDGNGNGAYDPGETFTDENGNGAHDADVGETGPGEAGSIVAYRMEYAWPLRTPLAGPLIGHDGKFVLKSAIAVRNEPYDQAVGAPAPGG